ncbi:hypothetical protein M422DRAFT_785320 [Sphaerobolus stellatus SS14]|uniref:T6SS Phospholipase effector Tle1-like catalytic domain-containing protein n=1 Tax=Sphaerobolus stellatus (strain SS14) TaxID=990650 RepID=A0A0C9ULJ0_SPHS4|nr:hypothetical protein M422DRAFT_785320 [Sphaerobolus stellatus SS14]
MSSESTIDPVPESPLDSPGSSVFESPVSSQVPLSPFSSSPVETPITPSFPLHHDSCPIRVPKRIVICCDGTWQDGIVKKHRWQYSNILKISRAIEHQDHRTNPPIPQIVFYQHGVGSEQNFYSEFIEGATGASLAEKVQEAYAFIAHNYRKGDEIFLFGFSRGAYTVRMVATFIGEIGILSRKDMDHFADIFIAFQKRGNAGNDEEKIAQEELLAKYSAVMEKGRARADPDGDGFTIKVLGVFDTVGSVGLPEELAFFSKKLKKLFGFHDSYLGHHIEHAYHAMALNETRRDFNVAKFIQTAEGRARGQILKQVWFPGSHSDVGGGWRCHDLSDITLAWMVSNIDPMLEIDKEYLDSLPDPVAPWGHQVPHDPITGIFKFALESPREFPTVTDEETQEYIHPSALAQHVVIPELLHNVKTNEALVCELGPIEQHFKDNWPFIEHELDDEEKTELHAQESMLHKLHIAVEKMEKKLGSTEIMVDEGGKPRYQPSWLGSFFHELVG